MSEYEQIFNKQELYDMLSKGKAEPLGDLYGVEDISLTIKELNEKIDWYKGLKKKKQEDINSAIRAIECKIDFFKKIILLTLDKFNEKSVDFPGSCQVVSRKKGEGWSILDEEEFINVLLKASDNGEDIKGAIEEVKEYVVRKKIVKQLLDTWEKNGTLEKYFGELCENKCVCKEPSSKIVSFSYSEQNEEQKEEVIDETVPFKDASSSTEEFDVLSTTHD